MKLNPKSFCGIIRSTPGYDKYNRFKAMNSLNSMTSLNVANSIDSQNATNSIEANTIVQEDESNKDIKPISHFNFSKGYERAQAGHGSDFQIDKASDTKDDIIWWHIRLSRIPFNKLLLMVEQNMIPKRMARLLSHEC